MGNDHEATCPSPSDLLERPNGKNSTVLSSPLTWLLYQLRLVSNELVTSFELASGTSGLVGSRHLGSTSCGPLGAKVGFCRGATDRAFGGEDSHRRVAGDKAR